VVSTETPGPEIRPFLDVHRAGATGAEEPGVDANTVVAVARNRAAPEARDLDVAVRRSDGALVKNSVVKVSRRKAPVPFTVTVPAPPAVSSPPETT